MYSILFSYQIKRYFLAYYLKKFISVTLKQDILFWIYLSLSHLDMVPILALMEHTFLLKMMMVQLSGILREMRNSLEPRAQVLSSSTMTISMATFVKITESRLSFF